MSKSLNDSINSISESLQNIEWAKQLDAFNETFIPEVAAQAFKDAKERQRLGIVKEYSKPIDSNEITISNWERVSQLTNNNETFIPEIAKTAFWKAKQKQSLEQLIISGKLSVVEGSL
jgi:hypothetical protein